MAESATCVVISPRFVASATAFVPSPRGSGSPYRFSSTSDMRVTHSAVVRIIAGSLKQDHGTVALNGRLGYCPQVPMLYEKLTCDETFALFGRAYNLTTEDTRARANRLYELYRQLDGLADLDADTRRTIEQRWFGGRTFDEVWAETQGYYARVAPEEIARAEANPKQKMAMVFRWYYVHSNRLALTGAPEGRVDYQIHCGPAMGAFNAWARGTPLENWRNRHVDAVAVALMEGAAAHLEKSWARLHGEPARSEEPCPSPTAPFA